jgi:hypothetical protein
MEKMRVKIVARRLGTRVGLMVKVFDITINYC